ncbi:MAG TPA: alpha-L-arabinofuranosidase C-terminal domain-containing protein [Candidatus Dormibacteraeota bacterium]|nr:alpha-L-arabinofuranosidase C-terminal domain-containing protein [Candidatus Dormibacteraeota bacterium]
MKVHTVRGLWFLALFFLPVEWCAGQSPASVAKHARITIDVSKVASYKIPRTIYGSFLEPIGNSIYGGLWADALTNPSFEDNLWSAGAIKKMIEERPELAHASELGLPLPWEPLDSQQNSRYAPRWNDAANSYRSLFLMGLPEEQVGIRQQVYLPIHRVLRYHGGIYAKCTSGPAEIEVSLRERNHPENTLAKSTFQLIGDDWRKYEFTLDLSPGKLAELEPADFVIAVSKEGRVLLDQVSLMPGDAVDGMDPDVIAMAKAMKTPIVRYGGNFTSAYNWRDGIGPRDKRVNMLNMSWGMPEYNTFGTDEFLRFCQLIGAQPQIALNLGTGTPQQAAEWVQYVNSRWGDKSGGLLWELGNELWGNFQVGYPTIGRAGARTKATSDAVRQIDPKAKLIATGGDPDGFHDWNAAQLANPSAYDYLSTHFVVTTDRTEKLDPSPDFMAAAAFALPVELERKLKDMRRQIQSTPGAQSVKTAFTEWLFWASENSGAPRFDNMGGAIATAGFLNMLMRVADFVPVSDMTGIMEFGGIWKKRGRVFGVPAYWAFTMYSGADATRPVDVKSDVGTYSVTEGASRLPTIDHVPYLDIVAALNNAGDKLTLFCVNRHLDRDIVADIAIDGFRPAAKASIRTLYAESILEKNDELNPHAIVPQPVELAVASSNLNYTFRHESVTVMEFVKK